MKNQNSSGQILNKDKKALKLRSSTSSYIVKPHKQQNCNQSKTNDKSYPNAINFHVPVD
ncbi:MAG: hypothetical protein IPK61_11715 [Saprospiraceae bacterium]|nr:hypothetical protein [Saprospiraceae bacterium]